MFYARFLSASSPGSVVVVVRADTVMDKAENETEAFMQVCVRYLVGFHLNSLRNALNKCAHIPRSKTKCICYLVMCRICRHPRK